MKNRFFNVRKLLVCSVLCLGFGELFAEAADVNGVDRYAIYVGSNVGGKNNQPLLYAGTDAISFQETMTEIGGISKRNSVLLLDPTKDDVDDAMDYVSQLIIENKMNSKRSEFVFYYSGHSDETSLLLGKTTYDYSQLKAAISEVPSDVHVVILDSCYSGNFIRTKGGSKQKPFLVDDASVVKGHAYLSSSSSLESSQESDEIGSSFFTSAMISGLRGAADSSGDKRVTLNELYSYAFNETLSKTENTTVGPQHPNYNITLVGSGDLVLSDISNSDCIVTLDSTIEGHVIIRDRNGKLVSEVNKNSEKPVYLALEQGQYSVSVNSMNAAYNGTFVLTSKNTYVLSEDDLTPVVRVANRTRGGTHTEDHELKEKKWEHFYDFYNRSDRGDTVYVPAIFSIFWNELQIPHNKNYSTTFGIGLIGSKIYQIDGLQASSVYNVADTVNGFQGSGVFNISAGKTKGFQGAGVFNICGEDLYGFQGAGVFNIAGGDVKGFQGAGVFNIAKNVYGAQYGLVNVAQEVHGVQLGLVNISKNGVCEVGVSYTSEENYRVVFNTGSNHLYCILGASIPRINFDSSTNSDTKKYESVFGIGTRQKAWIFNFDFELLVNQSYFVDFNKNFVRTTSYEDYYPSVRASLGITPVKHIMIYGGAMLNFEFDGKNSRAFENKPNNLTFKSPEGKVIFHPEFEAGVRISLN